MNRSLGLTQAVIASAWMKDGLIANADGSLSRALIGNPKSAGWYENDFEGPQADSLFARIGDLLSRLPDDVKGQFLFQRTRTSSGALKTKLYLFESVQKESSFSHLSAFANELGIPMEPLRDSQWTDLLSSFCGNAHVAELPDLAWRPSRVESGGQEIRVISLTELPQVTWPGCFQEVYEQNIPFAISLHFGVPKREKMRKRLESKRRVNHALSITSAVELRNIESNSVLSSAEETLDRILVGKECLYEISAALIVIADEADSERLTRDLVGVGAGIGNTGLYVEGLGSLPVLKSHIPGNAPLKVRQLPILSSNLAHILPLLLDYSRDHTPTELNLQARSGERSHLNLFSEANLNFNGFLCGASGSGKSFLMNSLLSAALEENPDTKICIFDIGGSYRKLVETRGGTAVDVTAENAALLIASYFRDRPAANNGLFRSLIEVLCGVGDHLTHSHRVAIGELLQTASGENLRITKLVKEAERRPEAYYRDLAHWLRSYSSIDELASDRTLMEALKLSVTAFDFKALSKDPILERTTVLILSSLIWDDLKLGKNPRTYVVFDEVWKFFKGVKDYIEEMYRTFRKYAAGIVSITQNAADYGDDEFARMIASNSFTKIFLEGGADRKLLSSGFDLSQSDIERVLGLASKKPVYSEFFVSSGAMSQAMRLYPTRELYAVANTERITTKR